MSLISETVNAFKQEKITKDITHEDKIDRFRALAYQSVNQSNQTTLQHKTLI